MHQTITLSAEGLHHGRILQAFDVLRRSIALEVHGDEGFHPGYDRLDLLPVPQVADHTVVCSAEVTESSPAMHAVSYLARAVAGGQPADSSIVVRGRGRTYALPMAP